VHRIHQGVDAGASAIQFCGPSPKRPLTLQKHVLPSFSVRKEHALRGSFQEITGKAPEYPLTQSRVTVGASNKDVSAIFPQFLHRIFVFGKVENPRYCCNAMAIEPRNYIVESILGRAPIGYVVNDLNYNNVLHFAEQR
jgi:hypothetical protein